MKASAQPTISAYYPRHRRITVGELREALKNMPDDADIKFAKGGYLEAPIDSPWKAVELKEREWPHSGRYVETCWE